MHIVAVNSGRKPNTRMQTSFLAATCEYSRLDIRRSFAKPRHSLLKRLDDTQTTGGNAHTGTAGAVDGGSVDSGDNGGMPTIMNLNSNNAGSGGGSDTGCAAGGKGATGGNASSGDSGTATGGKVRGSGGMMNVDSSEWLAETNLIIY